MKKALLSPLIPDNMKTDAGAETGISVDVAEISKSRIPFLLVICLVVLTFFFFANTINQYFLLDDFEVIYSAKYNALSHVLLGYDTVLEQKFFRPIPMLFTWILYKLFGIAPAPYHILSLLLHAGTAVAAANLVYLLHKRNQGLAAIVGVLFIVFPNHSEVINWPAITFTSWCAFFYLLSLNSFAYYRLSHRLRFLIVSLACFLAGMLSKEEAFTLPAVLIAFDFIFSRMRNLKYPLFRQMTLYGPYCFLLAGVVLLTRMHLKLGAGYLTVDGQDLISSYLNNIFLLLSDFIRMNLRAWKYVLAPISPKIPASQSLVMIVLFFVFVSLIILIWERRMAFLNVAFCFVFVSITTLPILGTFRVLALTHWIRFLYLPSVGGCYIFGVILYGLMSYSQGRAARYSMAVIAAIPIILLTKQYDHQWIEAQQENKEVMRQVREKLDRLPQYSRVYVEGIPWSQSEIPRIDYSFPAAVGLYYDQNQLQGALHFLPANKVLELGREGYSEQDWHYFRLARIAKTGEFNDPCEITPKREALSSDYWDFEKAAALSLLAPVNGIAPLRPGILRGPFFVIQGPWSLLWLPPVNPRQPVKYVSVELMVSKRAGGSDICRLFWISEDDRKISGGKSIGFFVQADGQFHTYKVPLYRNGLTLTHPRIVRLALRPSQEEGTIVSLKNLRVEYY